MENSTPCAYPKFTIAAGGFRDTPEGRALYAQCRKDGDMAPYEAAKAAYVETRRKMLPPPGKPVHVPVLPHRLRMAIRYSSFLDVLRAGPALEYTIGHDFPRAGRDLRLVLGLAFIAGIAEGKRRERARRKGVAKRV